MFAHLFNAKAALPLAAKVLGVPSSALEQLSASATAVLAPHAGSSFSMVPTVLALIKGDVSPLRSLYDSVLSVPALRPALAASTAEWLEANDPEHIAMKAMGYASDLPIKHLGRDFSSVEEFMTDGLFPLMDEVFKTQPVCHVCGGHLSPVAPGVAVCDDCETYKDV